ncbi:MAG: DUF1501 domain-containing protein [Gemmataceae bacterium]|nr:DUF1501 domain-containing protein [Gemmataceae bacterium]MDW8243302.1 DUF1501 domain-containing protein [Thermogemmata sp.]
MASYVGLNLPMLLRAEQQRRRLPTRADACLIIFLNGGPSHLDMWDPKPDAPAEIRGEFRPIPTSVPGVYLTEHLPKLARQMHRCTLIRSMHHSVNNAHAAAVYCALTGHDRGEIGGGARPDDHPCIGAVLARERPPHAPVPPHVLLPFVTKEGAGGPPQPGFFGGWLGKQYDPFLILKDPNAPDFGLPELTFGPEMTPERWDRRRRLIDQLLHGSSRLAPTDLDGARQRAYALLTAPALREALRLDREPVRLRDAYGRNIYGQSILLARRLIEAGTRVVCMSWAPDANATWDTHGSNFVKLKRELLPQFDTAVATLLEDLAVRGMLERTVVAVLGDFGRTPRINGNNAGRDHWNFCYSVLLAGGGFRAGYVHGASDRIGARPSLLPMTPADLIATIYACLGIPHDLELRDRLQRPLALCPWGSPIATLLN